MALFATKKADKELDDLFAKSASFATAPTPTTQASSSKRKSDEISTLAEQPAEPLNPDGTVKRKAGKKERPARAGKADKVKGAKAEKADKKSGSAGKRAGQVEVAAEDEDEEDEDDDTLEQQYASKPSKSTNTTQGTANEDDNEDDEDNEDPAMDVEPTNLEPTNSVSADDAKKNKKDRRVKKTKYTPEGESEVDRDRRTVFVGNVGVEILKSKSLQNQLKAHLLSFVPTASIESIRFRSIAFAAPTTQQEDPAVTAEKEEESRRELRDKERVKTWKDENEDEDGGEGRGLKRRRVGRGDDEDENPERDGKVWFKPGEKRKVAFLKGEFHKDVTSANAYVVFAHPAPDRSANVRPIMNPYEAATQVIAQGNNSLFQDRHLRLDAVRPTLDGIAKIAAAEGKSTLPARREIWTAGRDVKNSLFVGNLDAAAKEEDLRLFFEALVQKERGEEPVGGRYVVDVRIIRDRETQMAKGFGYIAFNERESVDEILALPSTKLRHAKRNLRVQPCKTLPSALGGREIKAAPTKDAKGKPLTKSGKPERKPPVVKKVAPVILPKVHGDPALGDKIATLSKDERKAFKSTDATRLARRAAKKQSAKLKDAMAGKRDKVKLDVKGTSKKLSGGKDKSKAKKSRVRSEHAAKKMKGKRD